MHGAPEQLARLAERKRPRSATSRACPRSCLAPPGLLVAAVAGSGAPRTTLPTERSAAAAVADMPGLVGMGSA